MLASTAHRRELLSSLQLPGTIRFGSTPVEPVRRLSTGIPALDSVLGGGIPRGGLSEITGPISSGRTALMCALLASATRQAETTAVVDLSDALHPSSLETVGADLHRILWIRPPSLRVSLKCTDLVVRAGGFGLVVLDLSDIPARRLSSHVWPRLAYGASQSQTTLAVLAAHRVAGSFATVSLALSQRRVKWNGSPQMMEAMAAMIAIARGHHRPGSDSTLVDFRHTQD